MKRLQLLLLFSLACFLLIPINVAHAKGTQVLVPDTVKDTHSKYTAKYKSGIGHTCTAILSHQLLQLPLSIAEGLNINPLLARYTPARQE